MGGLKMWHIAARQYVAANGMIDAYSFYHAKCFKIKEWMIDFAQNRWHVTDREAIREQKP
jgi:hypothetical protein